MGIVGTLRLNPTVALAALLASVPMAVQAQQTAGSISGRVTPGDTVVIANPALGLSRTAVVGSDGGFLLSQLPPGTYIVTLTRPGISADSLSVLVTAGQGALVSFGPQHTVTVTASPLRSMDVGSVSSGFALDKAAIDRTPVAQNVTALTLLAPGTAQGDSRLGTKGNRPGNLASIGGASVAENAYYINGFNVTNLHKGVAYNEVPFQGIAAIQVLNGGYGAEFGRSMGGVVSVNTRRGTGVWKGGASIGFEPDSLRGRSVYARKSEQSGSYDLVERPGTLNRLDSNLYLGGPLIQDRLYAFGLLQATALKESTYGEFTQNTFRASTPQYLLKVDWNITEDHLLEFTAFSDKLTERVSNYTAPAPYSGEHGPFTGRDEYTTGGRNLIAKWTSFLGNDVTLSALAGVGKYARSSRIASADCPVVQDARPPRATFEYKGCWSQSIISDPGASDERRSVRVDVEWKLGRHLVRAGLDNETFRTIDGIAYSGGHAYRVSTLAADAMLAGTGYSNSTGVPLDYVREQVFVNGGRFKTKNAAWYVEDNLSLGREFAVSAGLRNESFQNFNDRGASFIRVDNTWAPRVGASWDIAALGTRKLYAHAGRYFIPVYSNTNVRTSGSESLYNDFFAFDGTFGADAKQVPGRGPQLGTRVVLSDGRQADPRTIVDRHLKPMSQDEFILGFQQQVSRLWTVGLKWTNRSLRNGMDDTCEGRLAGQWAGANGYTQDQADAIESAIAGCPIYNPGGDLVINADINGDGNLNEVRIPAAALLMPKVKRRYDALEFLVERQWDGLWSAQGSFVIARSRGNTEGYVKSDTGQDDAGLTQDFDHPGLMLGADGPLPNDHRYTLKLSGALAMSSEWRLGATYSVQSGRPQNCLGNYAGPIADDSDTYGSTSFYCNGKLQPRGSQGRLPWTRELGLQTRYSPAALKGLSVTVDMLNALNARGVRAVNEIGELDSIGSTSPTYRSPVLGSLQRSRSTRIIVSYDF